MKSWREILFCKLELSSPFTKTEEKEEAMAVLDWEKPLNRLAFSIIKDYRARKYRENFFKLVLIACISWSVYYFWDDLEDKWLESNNEKHAALVDVVGSISSAGDTNADDVINSLNNAFKNVNTAGVIVRIDSPGGSPVHAGYINDEIWRLRAKYPKIPIYAVIVQMCASGGYYVAVATQKIYADKGSLVGSIGVRMDSFGFVGSLQKLGIERRLLTAGDHKGFLDPFLPERPEEVAHVTGLLSNIHEQFIATVKKGRGDRLKENPDIFSGLIWTGEQAKSLGLVDDFGSAAFVAREVIKVTTIRDYTKTTSLLDRVLDHLSTSMAHALPQVLYGSAQWQLR